MTTKELFEIEEWDMNTLTGWIDKDERTCCSLVIFKPEYGYVPVDQGCRLKRTNLSTQ